MRIALIALSASLLLLDAPAPLQAGPATVELAAAAEKKAAPKKARKEKVEYMKSAAPPEPKK